MLTRLIYASEAAAPLDPPAIGELLAQARRNNGLRDLTGMLAFDSRRFLQLIEGERSALGTLYAKIVADPRHRHVLLIEFRAIAERRYHDWQMGFAAADASRSALYLRHGPVSRFEPERWSAEGALAVLDGLAGAAGGGG